MNIVHYLPQFLGHECGTANAVRGWTEALAVEDHQVTVLSDEADIHRNSPPHTECIPLAHTWKGRARYAPGIGRHLEGADILVAHGGWTLANILTGRAAARARVPYLVTTHGVYDRQVLRRKRPTKLMWNAVVEKRHLDAALGLHLFFPDERSGLDEMGVTARTMVVPNGIAAPEGAAWDGGSGGYLLWLGRFDPYNKGLDLLIEAMAQLPESERLSVRLHGPDWRGHKAELLQLVDQRALGRWITIGDPIYGDDKWELISRAAACVYPSRWDACPVSVAEAVAVGVPTLVSAFPLGRMLAAEGAALEVELTVEAVAGGIRQLVSSAGSAIGERGAAVAADRLSWPAVAGSWIEEIGRLQSPGVAGP